MATGTILLPLVGHLDATNPPGIRVKNSIREPVFDETTPEIQRWRFRMPTDYASGLVFKGMVTMTGANTGTKYVQIGVSVEAVDDGEDGGTESFDTENAQDVQISNTAETQSDVSVTLTNSDSAAAGDRITIKLRRVADAGVGHDDASGDMALTAAALEYTTT